MIALVLVDALMQQHAQSNLLNVEKSEPTQASRNNLGKKLYGLGTHL